MVKRIGIIGFGNMGEAMAAGLQHSFPQTALAVCEKSDKRRHVATTEYGCLDCGYSVSRLAEESDLIILAVKPHDLTALFSGSGKELKPRPIISVLAGTPIARIREAAPGNEFARFMPSLAARVGKAVVGVCFAADAGDEFRATCLEIAGAIGTPQEIPERLMSAITGASGSGIAFVFSFIHAMAMGGTKAGIPYPQSLAIALDVLEGATAVLKQTGEHPVSMLSKVCSPAGTTIEGVQALEEGAFTAIVMEAVERAAGRAAELEG